MEKADKKLVSFRFPEDLLQSLRTRAHQDNISVTELVCRLLQQGLKANENDRIEKLEAELRELKQAQQASFSSPAPPFYGYPPNLQAAGSDADLKQRIGRLEALMETVLLEQRTYSESMKSMEQALRETLQV